MYCIGRQGQFLMLLPTKMDLSSPPSLFTVWSSPPPPHPHFQNGVFFNTQIFSRLNWYVFLFSLFLFLSKICFFFFIKREKIETFWVFFFLTQIVWFGVSWFWIKLWRVVLDLVIVLSFASGLYFFYALWELDFFFYIYGFWFKKKKFCLGIFLGGFVCFRW